MKKLYRYSLLGLGGLLVSFLLLWAVFIATFDIQNYKPLITQLIKKQNNRTLTMEGDISLVFWPRLSLRLNKATLSEYNSAQEFASVQSAQMALALRPLLKKQLVIDTITLHGARVHIIQHKNGKYNFDDLLTQDSSWLKDFHFNIAGVRLRQSEFNYTREATGAQYKLSGLNLDAGPFAENKPIAFITTFSVQNVAIGPLPIKIKTQGQAEINPKTPSLLMKQWQFHANQPSSKNNLSLYLTTPELNIQKDSLQSKKIIAQFYQETLSASLKTETTLSHFKGTAKNLSSETMVTHFQFLHPTLHTQGTLTSPLNIDIENFVLDFPHLNGDLTLKNTTFIKNPIPIQVTSNLHIDLKQEQIHSPFALKIDTTQLHGDLALTHFKEPKLKFSLSADNINFDPFFSNTPTHQAINLSEFAPLWVEGHLNLRHFTYKKFQGHHLNLQLHAKEDQLALSQIKMQIDDSNISGNIRIAPLTAPIYTLNLAVDTLDMNKYLPADTLSRPSQNNLAAPDFSFLKNLPVAGSIRIKQLKYAQTQSNNLHIDLIAQ